MTFDQFQYIRDFYGRTFFIGQLVLAGGKPGVVTGASHHVHVRLDGKKYADHFHPTDVQTVVAPPGDPR